VLVVLYGSSIGVISIQVMAKQLQIPHAFSPSKIAPWSQA